MSIVLSSVATNDAERDSTLVSEDWFGDREAVFRAATFEATGDGNFRATDATLTFGATPHPIDFVFGVTRTGNGYRLTGRARLDRLALQVGRGDWQDTTWVGQFVAVEVVVMASLAP